MRIDVEKKELDGSTDKLKNFSKTKIWAMVVKLVAVLAMVAGVCMGFYFTHLYSDGATRTLFFVISVVAGFVIMALLMLYANQALDIAEIKDNTSKKSDDE